MIPFSPPAALDALERAAAEVGAAESQLRDQFAKEIAQLETDRRRAYRRFHFLSALVSADATAADRETSRAAQRLAAAEELEWAGRDAARDEVLDAMTPLADAVHDDRLAREEEARAAAEARPEADAEPVAYSLDEPAHGEGRETALLIALSDFEARFEALRGKPFAELFDRYMPDTPLVDF
ncbi:hypothetical protein [Hansschlegelia zhihuaiae]|uniref:Uncharacterized protein n=1 Tax=Hansschlegelia zhihuaiae TaxID=405005 RepID=A0A4Q0MPB5_9HYPH|nr:hypothetical protein [Hansschlegelia zhihuaiae]RXF74979.1 hypothetical protein EK403_02665 [Hansschlegelia zhihuaiae]